MYAAHHRKQKQIESQQRYKERYPGRSSAASLRWRERNPEKAKQSNGYSRKRYLKHKFNLTEEQFTLMANKQNWCCIICQKPKKLHVDHDHNTDKIRGLLCNGCNMALGMLADNKEYLQRALAYLDG
jgi:hypothetical protein